VEHPSPHVIVDIDQPESVLTPGGQPLIRMITIVITIPFYVLINSDTKVNLMSLQVFLTL
jgi:hypothetical protein